MSSWFFPNESTISPSFPRCPIFFSGRYVGTIHAHVRLHSPMHTHVQAAPMRKEFESVSAPMASMTLANLQKFHARMLRKNGDKVMDVSRKNESAYINIYHENSHACAYTHFIEGFLTHAPAYAQINEPLQNLRASNPIASLKKKTLEKEIRDQARKTAVSGENFHVLFHKHVQYASLPYSNPATQVL